MSALGQWLKEIILIVILAVMTDLLLPTKAMQRYVRMVMGLAIIAAMLQPMMPFFRRDWADQVAAYAVNQLGGQNSASAQGGTSTASGSAESSNGLSQSVDQGEIQRAFASAQAQRADELVAQEVAAQIQQQFHCKVNRVRVENVGQNTDAMTVQIEIGLQSRDKRQIIQHGIANALAIDESQVEVTVGGGDTSGP